MKKYLLILVLFIAFSAQAQIQWPAITQTTKPWTRWWWQGSAVDKKNLTAAMQQYQQAGLGGLEITPIYGVKGYESSFINFLSPQWMDLLQYTLQEANRLGLGIDMANATGWPFGGPWITPADASKNINTKIYLLNEGESLNDIIRYTQAPFYRSESKAQVDLKKMSYPVATNQNLQHYAFDQVRFEMVLKPINVIAYANHGAVIDLTRQVDDNGRLHWTAPAGTWKVYALFIGYHGKMVERAAPGGEGDVIDHFSARALHHYLKKFDAAFTGKNIQGIRSFFNDSYEVDDARGQSNWTPELLKEFQIRRGYDLIKYLPQLLGRDSSDTGRRVLADYRQTISDLLLDNFTKPWHQWAKEKNKMVRNQSHGSPANILDLYAVVDIPETEGADILRYKFATSTANITGKPLVSSETATWLNEHFQSSLGDVKQAVDKYFIGGVNHIFWHGTNYSPQNEPWPGWLFYAAVHFTPANPFWKDFHVLNQYVTRVQSFLQKGKPDNEVLLYFPFNDRIHEMGRDLLLHFDGMEGFDKTVFKSGAEWLLTKGYGFDLISDKQLTNVQNNGATLQTGGITYRTILLSGVKYLPLATLQKLVQLAEKGATIIFYQNVPTDVPGLSDLTNQQKIFTSIIHQLKFRSLTGTLAQKAPIGKGAFLLGNDLSQLLQQTSIQRETFVDEGLQYVRRKNSNGHTYFISNPTASMFANWVPVTTKEKNIVLFNPMNSEKGIAQTRIQNGKVAVWLQLEAGSSCILQTSNKVVTGNRYPYYVTTSSPIELFDKWDLHFIDGGPVLPTTVTQTILGSWTGLPGEEVKAFSGTAGYRSVFRKPKIVAEKYLLNLGSVQETAEVMLNGKSLAVLIGPSFTTVVPAALLQEENVLEIIVTNGMANRIAALDRKGVVWKKFYNTNFPARFPQNRGSDGLFTAATWLPKPSGLIGPVTLQPLQKK